MIFIYCLRTHVVLWHSGKRACLVNRRSLVQIILWFVIMLTRLICQNDFHLLSMNSSGAVGQGLKRLSSKQRRSLVQIRAVPHFQIILWFAIMLTRLICQNDFHLLSTNSRGAVAQRYKRLSSKQRRYLVQIRAVPHFQIILWFVIMSTKFIYLK